jgi:glycerol-3-phosphate acyltransferase PlsY
LDLSKGWLAVSLGLWLGVTSAFALGLLAACAVAGHCWPVWAGFRGGMGLASAGGALLALSPLAFATCLGVVIAFVLAVRHSARGVIAGAVFAAPVLWLLGSRGAEVWVAGLVGVVLILRFASDWNRKYRELWLDRDRG